VIFWYGFAIGIFVGGAMGTTVTALAVAAKRRDRHD